LECYEELVLREGITRQYGINDKNDSRSSIGNKLMIHSYSEATGLKPVSFMNNKIEFNGVRLADIIDKRIEFKTEFFKGILEYLKTRNIIVQKEDETELSVYFKTVSVRHYPVYVPKTVNEDDKQFLKLEFILAGNRYTIGLGGLHSKDEAGLYQSTDNEYIVDADVTSYYPSILINFKIAPEQHDLSAFLDIVRKYRDDRVLAKKEQDTVKAEILKIAINRIYGSLADEHDMNYDPKALYSVTLNGELSLLMLIEELHENKIEILSTNTDGILCRVHKSLWDKYNEICGAWQEKTGFNLEFTEYEKYIRRDVNAYIALKKGFSQAKDKSKYVKYKNIFDPAVKLEKGYKHPVITIAILNYFIKGISVEDTIKNHISTSEFAIYDYCIAQKVGKQFKIVYRQYSEGTVTDTELQHTNRYYICKNNGGMLFKLKELWKNNRKITQEIALITQQVRILNNYYYEEDYNIDFNYYIKIANQVLYGASKKKKKVKEFGILHSQSKLF
jgi:hypothetical protein